MSEPAPVSYLLRGDGVPRPPPAPGRARSGPESSGPQAISTARPVLLVVDDDAGVREALHLILDDEYTVLDAAHGRAALSIVRAERVDLVLLDVLMPEVDGIEILQELKALEPDRPVVMVTAVKTVRTTVAAMKLGALDYVTKPFQEEELLGSIRRALEQRVRRPSADRARPDSEARLPRTHRILLVGGDLGWRATLAVTLARVGRVETASTIIDGLNRVLRFRPTCVVLDVGRSSAEATRFLGGLHAQLPACPVLVVSDDAYLDAAPVWENLNIRGVMRPPVDPGALASQIEAVGAPPGDAPGSWPQVGGPVSRAIDYLGVHFGGELTVDSVAKVIGISGRHLRHLFRAETGMTVMDYLARVRVAIAQDLLAHTDDKLVHIAARVGFFDGSHLTRVFREITGKAPSAYRRSPIAPASVRPATKM